MTGEGSEASSMAKNPFRHIRLVYRRSSLLVKCVVLAAILLSTVALVTLRMTAQEAQAKTNELRQQAAVLEQENQQLTQNVAELDTVQGVRRIATEILGLVDPDTVFFQPVNPDISE